MEFMAGFLLGLIVGVGFMAFRRKAPPRDISDYELPPPKKRSRTMWD